MSNRLKMNAMMLHKIGLWCLPLLALFTLLARADDSRQSTDFTAVLEKLPVLSKDEAIPLSETERYQMQRRLAVSSEFLPHDIVRLWLAEERELLVLSWFRQSNRDNRLLIAALILCERVQVLWDSGTPLFAEMQKSAVRFAKPEAEERKSELALVVDHAPAYARRILKIVNDAATSDQQRKLRYTAELAPDQYKTLRENGWFGSRSLPR